VYDVDILAMDGRSTLSMKEKYFPFHTRQCNSNQECTTEPCPIMSWAQINSYESSNNFPGIYRYAVICNTIFAMQQHPN